VDSGGAVALATDVLRNEPEDLNTTIDSAWRQMLLRRLAQANVGVIALRLMVGAVNREDSGALRLWTYLLAYGPLIVAAAGPRMGRRVTAGGMLVSFAAVAILSLLRFGHSMSVGLMLTSAVLVALMAFRLRGALIALALSTLALAATAVAVGDGRLAPTQAVSLPPVYLWRNVVGFLGVNAGLVFALDAILERFERSVAATGTLVKTLRREARERQFLTRQIGAVAEEERKRIAHELHDDVGQRLTAIKIGLQMGRLNEPLALVDELIHHVRSLSRVLRPPLLDEAGLLPAVCALVESEGHRAGLAVEIDVPQATIRLPMDVEIVCYRAIQEAVTNVLKHACARRLMLSARSRDRLLELVIADDGVGFDPVAALVIDGRGEHFGLRGIYERLRTVGADVVLQSNAARGTTLSIGIPLDGTAS